MLFPTTPDAAHAEETTMATLAIQPTLAVTLPNTVNFEVQPTAAGAVTSGSATLSISTNNETGYSLYLSTADDDNALHSINPDTQQTITALTQENATAANFTNNTWGYSLSKDTATDSTTYQSVPTTQPSDPQITTEAPATDTYNLTFAAKVDSSLPSGTYINTVTVSVVANPAYVPNLAQISNMQDMTTEICNASIVGQTNRLTDTRDGKLYWVAKLADNQCWMTQNLDFDIPADGLTNENGLAAKTDLPDGTVWDSTSGANAPQPTNTAIENVYNSSNYYSTYSYDPGYYVKSDPDAYNSYCSNVSGLNSSSCTSAGWVNVSDGSGYTALTEEQTGTASSGSTTYEVTVVNEDAKTYDAHYLVGNYYQWNAATAGTGGESVTSGNATGSICPKGWKLPTDSHSANSFEGLLKEYDITGTPITAEPTQAPLYFNPSGDVDSESLESAGNNGGYWSSAASSRTGYANYLYFESDYYHTSFNAPRYVGWSVRCLAR